MSQEKTSPSRLTRVQEKEEMVELNDRFLHYIEQVRSMKEANLSLEMELSEVKEQIGHEAESVKALYEAELADARNLIDETAKEKARQQIIASKNASRIEDLEAELKEVKDALERMETKYNAAQRSYESAEAQRKSAQADKNKFQNKVKDLEAELAELRESYETVKSSLEHETLSKVDLQNHIQSHKEEMAFKKKVHEEELAHLREKTTSFTGVYETRFQAELDSRLMIAIDELREESDRKIEVFKEHLETEYRGKIDRYVNMIEELKKELRKASHFPNEDEIRKLQIRIETLEATIRELKNERDRERRLHAEELAHKDEELHRLLHENEVKIHEYEELMDVKIQLDQEIATYRALLTGEETRLNLTPTPREKRTRSYTKSSTVEQDHFPIPKKPRTDSPLSQSKKTTSSSTAAGHIQITHVDSDGRYIEITNVSEDVTESIGGLKIHHEVEGEAPVTFKFHNKSKLQGGAAVKVWSSNAEDAKHDPPTDFISRNPTWGTGQKTITKIIKGKEEEELAVFKQNVELSPYKQREEMETGTMDSSTHSFPHLPVDTERDPGSSGGQTTRVIKQRRVFTSTQTRPQRTEGEHVFHQRGDPEAGEKSCIIS